MVRRDWLAFGCYRKVALLYGAVATDEYRYRHSCDCDSGIRNALMPRPSWSACSRGCQFTLQILKVCANRPGPYSLVLKPWCQRDALDDGGNGLHFSSEPEASPRSAGLGYGELAVSRSASVRQFVRENRRQIGRKAWSQVRFNLLQSRERV